MHMSRLLVIRYMSLHAYVLVTAPVILCLVKLTTQNRRKSLKECFPFYLIGKVGTKTIFIKSIDIVLFS